MRTSMSKLRMGTITSSLVSLGEVHTNLSICGMPHGSSPFRETFLFRETSFGTSYLPSTDIHLPVQRYPSTRRSMLSYGFTAAVR